MLETLGIVQACHTLQEPTYHLKRRLGGRPLLEWVIRRVTDSIRLDGVIVVACDAAEHRFVADLVPMDVPVFFGNHTDPLERFARALEEYPAKAIVRVRGDNPFIDPALIDRLIRTAEEHPECDYVSYVSADGRPAILSPVGVYAEWVRVGALRKAARAAKNPADRAHVTRYIYSHPEKFRVRLIPAPPEIDRDDVRLTVDGEEDWEHALAIFDALGPDCLDWQRIAVLLDHQPRLRSRMAALNRVGAGS
ncbi:MAG: NTP transferase domain-containing protein [Thermoguttaceae bacterium]|jgi:spore coat polysaccharide biosynthesis protein SpsF|nr:NTP transferase domain-containing protein [Thermoguttaceae bacterium]